MDDKRKCLECGNVFVAKHHKEKLCSDACRKKRRDGQILGTRRKGGAIYSLLENFSITALGDRLDKFILSLEAEFPPTKARVIKKVLDEYLKKRGF